MEGKPVFSDFGKCRVCGSTDLVMLKTGDEELVWCSRGCKYFNSSRVLNIYEDPDDEFYRFMHPEEEE